MNQSQRAVDPVLEGSMETVMHLLAWLSMHNHQLFMHFPSSQIETVSLTKIDFMVSHGEMRKRKSIDLKLIREIGLRVTFQLLEKS